MQTNPALPWAAGQGGTITFQEPVTLNQLLAGEIVIGLTKNGEPANDVRFYENQGGITLMAGGDTVFGVTIRNNTLSLGYIYSDGSYSLTSVQRVPAYTIEVYTDSDAEIRPTIGESYEELFIKITKIFDESNPLAINEGSGNTFNYTPPTEQSNGLINLFGKFEAAVVYGDELAGQIVFVNNVEATPMEWTEGRAYNLGLI